MSKEISEGRKFMYYAGLGLMALGFILFLSSFFTFFSGDPMFFDGPPAFFTRALIGMICMIVGSILRGIGARGTAGSGLVLDPERAREDLKPYSRATGGMINDALEGIDFEGEVFNKKKREIKEIIKIKCRACNSLNDEDAKFCKECGREL